MQTWTKDGEPEIGPLVRKQVISWHYDEVIFYAHDCRGKGWHYKNAPAKPYQKGDGASLMISDYCSAEFG
jgi:hypothetical protein